MSEGQEAILSHGKNALDSICLKTHIPEISWQVIFADEFYAEFAALEADVQDELLAQANVIQALGPLAKRPRVDTLKGSRHANMKELRFSAAGGEWRAAFAFDPTRRAIVLAAADKSGLGNVKGQKKFYDDLIAKADARFDAHLRMLSKQRREI